MNVRGIRVAGLAALGLLPLGAQMAFEVASVRPHQGSFVRSGPLNVSSSLIRMEGYTIFGLVLEAYGVKDYQLTFGKLARPEDAYDDMYDIVARAPGWGVPGAGEVRAMLQTLLADRFGMRVHREMKELPVYALVAGKNGPKLKESGGEGECRVHVGLAEDGRNDEAKFSHCGMDELTERMGKLVGERPVVDRTGLAGRYDFSLIAIPEYRSRGRSDAADVPATIAVERLGLKLVAEKAEVEIVVVDRFEKPGEN